MVNIKKIIIYTCMKNDWDFDKTIDFIRRKEKCDFDEVERAVPDEVMSQYVTILDEDYPGELKWFNNPAIAFRWDVKLPTEIADPSELGQYLMSHSR